MRPHGRSFSEMALPTGQITVFSILIDLRSLLHAARSGFRVHPYLSGFAAARQPSDGLMPTGEPSHILRPLQTSMLHDGERQTPTEGSMKA